MNIEKVNAHRGFDINFPNSDRKIPAPRKMSGKMVRTYLLAYGLNTKHTNISTKAIYVISGDIDLL
jgi:hypothetical protein